MSPIAIVHLDESCLGNGREGENPGGSAGLIEARNGRGKIQRRDFFISSPATTNNRMALSGAIAALSSITTCSATARTQGLPATGPGGVRRVCWS